MQWSYNSDGWLAQIVSVGDNGLKIFNHHSGVDNTLLFSSGDSNPPTPLIDYSLSYLGIHPRAASAKSADVHVTLEGHGPSSSHINTLRKYSSQSTSPEWEKTVLPTCIGGGNFCHTYGIFVSDDGNRIITYYAPSFGGLEIEIFDAAGNSLNGGGFSFSSSEIPTMWGSGFDDHGIIFSGDGLTAVVETMSILRKTYFVDLVSGTVINPGGTLHYPDYYMGYMGIDGDGSIVAQSLSGNNIRLYEKQGNNYVHLDDISLSGKNPLTHLDLTPSGDKLAATYHSTSGDGDFIGVAAWDLNNNNNILMNYGMQGENTIQNQNYVVDLEISDDGERFAIGLNGEENTFDQLWLFSTTQSEPLASFATIGPARELAVSLDGKKIASAISRFGGNTYSGGEINTHQIL